MSYHVPEFLSDLLTARSPSGHEFEAQNVLDKHLKPQVDEYTADVMGNRYATVNPGGDPVLMFSGHMDELGLMVSYIDKNGYIYFSTIGGHDRVMISGRRVTILTKNGAVKGVTGKRAIHLMNEDDRKKVPQIHEMWLDIGATSKEEAQERVSIGDVAVYDQALEIIQGSIAVARAFDNKAGCYLVSEAAKRLAKQKHHLAAKVVSVATTQEEIGVRGATTASYAIHPDYAVAVDVTHATDHPDCDNRKFGEVKLGAGPVICRGPNINPQLFNKLVEAAQSANIPYQLESDPRPTPTDARAIQMARDGVACSLVSIPLRYMHTPSEVVDLQDIEHGIQLLVALAKSLKPGERGIW